MEACNLVQEKNGENVSHLEITEVIFIHSDFVGNSYYQNARVLYLCSPNKSLAQLEVLPAILI